MFAQHYSEILAFIGENPTTPYEIEARWNYRKDNFPFAIFDRTRKQLSELVSPIVTDTLDRIDNQGIRITTSRDNQEIYLRKKQIFKFNNTEYDLDLVVSSEENLTSNEVRGEDVIERRKKRWSFNLETVRIDLTEVDHIDYILGKTINRYEFELELVDLTSLSDLDLYIENFHKIIYATENIYTIREKDDMIKTVNRLLGSTSTGTEFDTNTIRKIRDVRWDDLQYGGIVGNKETSYSISPKVDGENRLIVLDKKGLWVIDPPYYINLLQIGFQPGADGQIMWGSEVSKDRRNENAPLTQWWFVIFDCLVRNSIPLLGNYNQRLIEASELCTELDNLNPSKFRFTTISSWELKLSSFYDTFLRVYSSLTNLRFKHDGIIITPNNVKPQPFSDTKPLNERILTKYPDTCRLKLPEMNTIDFSLRWIPGEILDLEVWIPEEIKVNLPYIPFAHQENSIISLRWDDTKKKLFSQGTSKNIHPTSEEIVRENYTKEKIDLRIRKGELYAQYRRLVSFRGDDQHSFTPSKESVDTEGIQDLPSGSIVEFTYSMNKFIPLRQRSNRNNPNSMEQAQIVWSMIFDPIAPSIFMEDNPSLFKKHINRHRSNRVELNESLFNRRDKISFMDWDPSALIQNPRLPSTIEIRPDLDRSLWDRLLIAGAEPSYTMNLDTDPLLRIEFRGAARCMFKGELNLSNLKMSDVSTPNGSPSEEPEAPLPAIPVPDVRGHVIAPFDDQMYEIQCTWSPYPLARIGCIADGSCFFHAYLKGFFQEYRQTRYSDERKRIVRNVRNQLAQLLTESYPPDPSITYYDSIGGGNLKIMGSVAGMDDYYTLNGLRRLLMSTNDVGDEVYSYVAEVCNVDVYVVRGTVKDLYRHTTTASKNINRKCVVIMGQGSHYELIAAQIEGGFQTSFDPGTIMYDTLRQLYGL